MDRLWAVLFGVVMLACGLLFFVAPFAGWWMPEGVSTHAAAVDDLFYVILVITGFFFFLTEGILVYFMYFYAGEPNKPKPARPSGVPGFFQSIPGLSWATHDQHRVEMAWTLVPALILIYISFAQIGTWSEVKYQKNAPEINDTTAPVLMDVSARQFEWRVRYPHPERVRKWLDKDARKEKETRDDWRSFAKVRQSDDIELVNEIHCIASFEEKGGEKKWKNPAVVYLTTRDVIHSFNIPVMRVKQDALPGKMIPLWFTPTKSNASFDKSTGTMKVTEIYDLACAELCGWGHYRMIGHVYVHPSEDDYMAWLEDAAAKAHSKGH